MGRSPAERTRGRSVSWNILKHGGFLMRKPKLLIAALAASALGAIVPMPAAADVGVFLDVAPPAPRYEVVPAPRHGYVWEPGYWDWRHGRYAWVQGHWIREKRGMYWHPSHWEHRDGRWVLERGGWHRDKWNGRNYARRDTDHDGIPNRRDRDMDNDGVPNRRDFDRDNDGIPNRVDRAPNNPRVR
jgi:hypothetical protein